MRVRIDRHALGTPTSLVIDHEGGYEWSNDSCDASLCSQSHTLVPLEDLARMQGLPESNLQVSDSAHQRSFEVLGVSGLTVPWVMVMGRQKFTARIQGIVKATQEVIRDPEVVRYVSTYREGNSVLRSLQRPRIDLQRLRQHRTDDVGGLSQLSALTSFSPDDDGLAPAIVYDRASTATGRLKVARGPAILTLQKECRDIITSRVGGTICEIDFVSLEPRVALNVMGINASQDIYEGVRERLNMSGLTRQAVKQAVISALYGSSSAALAESLGGRREAQGLIREVKAYFHVAELVTRLRSEMARDGGRLHNYYGRPLNDIKENDPDSKIISYYLQSTAVDVALLGFKDLISRFHSSGIMPIYVIHDAILFDVPVGLEERLQRECVTGVDLEMGHFALGLKGISR